MTTCLFKESFPAIPFWNSKHLLPTRSLRFLRAASGYTSSALWLHHAHQTCHMQRSRGSGRGVVVSKICYNTVIVLSVVLCDCVNEQLPRLSIWPPRVGNGAVNISAADVRNMWCTAEKRYVPHVCLRDPFPLFLCGIPTIQPIRSLRFLRAALRSAISALNGCIMPIPSLQLQKKIVLSREAEGLVTELCPKNCYNIVILLSVVLWDCCKPMIQLLRLSF